MDPPVFTALKASTEVKNIVGTNPPRVWHNNVPEDIPRPLNFAFVTWFSVSNVPENNLSDPPPCDRDTVQVDIYHPKQVGLGLLVRASRDALEAVGVMTGLVFDGRDEATTLYRKSLQFDIFTDH